MGIRATVEESIEVQPWEIQSVLQEIEALQSESLHLGQKIEAQKNKPPSSLTRLHKCLSGTKSMLRI
ncbi:hypothetical protein LBWT_33340 [Leptolyngbya boryana IAM M-101]|nr:hypothetical protein LBWT_33340 [Leptolyngbya boryana IAM M-101]BAS63727.1 hypothetical protein LBDG_33340 [Leptolyngbya boryana dg5]